MILLSTCVANRHWRLRELATGHPRPGWLGAQCNAVLEELASIGLSRRSWRICDGVGVILPAHAVGIDVQHNILRCVIDRFLTIEKTMRFQFSNYLDTLDFRGIPADYQHAPLMVRMSIVQLGAIMELEAGRARDDWRPWHTRIGVLAGTGVAVGRYLQNLWGVLPSIAPELRGGLESILIDKAAIPADVEVQPVTSPDVLTDRIKNALGKLGADVEQPTAVGQWAKRIAELEGQLEETSAIAASARAFERERDKLKGCLDVAYADIASLRQDAAFFALSGFNLDLDAERQTVKRLTRELESVRAELASVIKLRDQAIKDGIGAAQQANIEIVRAMNDAQNRLRTEVSEATAALEIECSRVRLLQEARATDQRSQNDTVRWLTQSNHDLKNQFRAAEQIAARRKDENEVLANSMAKLQANFDASSEHCKELVEQVDKLERQNSAEGKLDTAAALREYGDRNMALELKLDRATAALSEAAVRNKTLDVQLSAIADSNKALEGKLVDLEKVLAATRVAFGRWRDAAIGRRSKSNIELGKEEP